MRIVFFGTPPFAADVLTYLLENNVQVVGVISRPDKPQGRSGHPVKGPVRLVAEAKSLPHYQPEKVSSPDFIPTLVAFNADLFIVVAYGEILTQQVLDIPSKACINLHASLLPKYRGAAPIQRAIINGENETGISIMYMVKKMDAGDVILKRTIPIEENMTYQMLDFEMRKLGSAALMEVIWQFESGNIPREIQNELEVTFAPKIELEDCQIVWEKSAKSIHDLIRGVNPEPGAWCLITINGEVKRLKVFSSLVRKDVSLTPKECIFEANKNLLVGCGNFALELLEVQLEGKKRMRAADFYRGLSKKHLEIT